jgi:hypothetical protein
MTRIRPLPILLGAVSGAVLGASLMVLLQQFAVLALSRSVLLTAVVAGVVVGVLLPVAAGLIAGRGARSHAVPPIAAST